MLSALKTWKQTIETLSKNPVIFLPFFIVGLFDALSLILFYLAPQPPISFILAPPIRAFRGEQYLHYPVNFVLLPQLFNFAHIIVTGTIGIVMTGLAIGMLKDTKAGNKPGILFNFIYAVKRYFIIMAVWLIMFILAFLVYRIPGLFVTLGNKAILQSVFFLCFFIAVLIQVVFIYAIPAAIIERRGLVLAIKRGLVFSKNHFLTTLLLILIPSILFIPIIVLKGNLIGLMNRFFPEIVLIVLGIGIAISVLIDCIITCSTAILFLNKREGS